MATNEDDLSVYTLKSFRENLSDIVGKVKYAKKRIKVTNRGKTAGYFVPEEDVALLELAIERLEDEEDRKAIDTWLDDPDKETVHWEEIKQENNLE